MQKKVTGQNVGYLSNKKIHNFDPIMYCQPLSFWVCLPCQQYYWEYKMSWQVHKRKIYLHFTQLRSSVIWQWHALVTMSQQKSTSPQILLGFDIWFHSNIYFLILLFHFIYQPNSELIGRKGQTGALSIKMILAD